MVKQEIVEGLKLALSRGYNLENAMMSFYNAGYRKEEIEEAARELYKHPSTEISNPNKKISEEFKKPVESFKALPVSNISDAVEKTKKEEEKKIGVVSTYEEKPKSNKKWIILIILLLIFILGAIGFILFKDQLMALFS